jgi:hypothetical protein
MISPSRLAAIACATLLMANTSSGYSVLSHEAVIDAAWETHLKPMLLRKFPAATADELKEAHAYAYGGSVAQDVGYVPFSSKTFSDLAHYARSGDFVVAMIRDAQTIDEYAFALGSLAHYVSDNTGHPTVNRTTGLLHRDLRVKFGELVTYEDNPGQHLKTEFSFDVVQVSRAIYAPTAYHDFVGFQISKPILERAFLDTYGIELKDVFNSYDLGVGTYRFTIGSFVPALTNAAWQSKRKDIEQLSPGITRSKYVWGLPRGQYEKEWGKSYRGPGFGARLLAAIFKVIPKIGPFKVLAYQHVTPDEEREFLRSFEATVVQYKTLLSTAGAGTLTLPNRNLDTGNAARTGEYRMADEAHQHLLEKLADKKFAGITPELKRAIADFFSGDRLKLPVKTQQLLAQMDQEPRALDTRP